MGDAPDYSHVGVDGLAATIAFLTAAGDKATATLDATGHLQSDTLTSALPSGATVSAFQPQKGTFIVEQVFTSDASAGVNTQAGTAVPAGEVWRVTACYGTNVNKSITLINFQLQRAGGSVPVQEWLTPTLSRYSCWYGEIWLAEGDKVKMNFDGCDSGNDLQFAYSYDKFDVT